MPDVAHGKSLFEGLVDYPLPEVAGVRDYVFYFVPNTGYGKSARKFFQKFYPNHVGHDVASLPELIGTLDADVTQDGVRQIRELVIVSHGTSVGLMIPLLASTADDNLKVLTAYSIAVLQKQLPDGALADLKAKRAVVVSHLHPDSWVTVRACNFGQSEAGMYALYSFFGGNADVYAPKLYQLFGDQPIVEGMRYPTRLAVHEHLVKQRFLPKDVHTPDRQDAIVRALTDPASFAAPFTLSTETLGGAELPEYGGLIDSLNAKQTSATLKTKFHQNGFDLTADAKVTVVVQDNTWTIRDTITDPGADTPFVIEFTVGEQVEEKRTLVAQASLPAAYSAAETVISQLFLESSEEDEYKGQLFKLAYSRDDDDANAANKETFDALRALLEANGANGQTFSAGQIDLRTVFEDAGAKLADDATIRLTSVTPPKDDQLSQEKKEELSTKTWTVGPGVNDATYLIKLEHPYEQVGDSLGGVNWTQAHTLNAFQDLDRAAELRAQDNVLAHIGNDPDSPGVELAASMDRLSADDLLDLITYLRTPYKPRNVIYLHHAQQATIRKGNYLQWLMAHIPDPNRVLLPDDYPLPELHVGEAADRLAMVYEFDFNTNWAEVKASNRTPIPYQQDLFLEESLAKRFKIPDNELGTRAALALEDDSPYSDAAELRHLESLGFNQYFAVTQKQAFTAPSADERVSCADFRAAVFKLKDLSGAPVEQLSAALAGEQTAAGTSYLKIILDLRDKYAFLQNLAELTELNEFLKLPEIIDPTSAYDVAKTVGKYVAKVTKWEIGVDFFEGLGVLDLVITLPLAMWLEMIERQAEGSEQAVAMGRITAIRNWLRRLQTLTYIREGDFPDDVVFDMTVPRLGSVPNLTLSYYRQAYVDEVEMAAGTWPSNPNRVITSEAELKEGFDAGAAAMTHIWPVMLRYVQQAMADVLRGTNLDSCQVQALVDAGLLDLSKLKATIVREFAQRLLKELP